MPGYGHKKTKSPVRAEYSALTGLNNNFAFITQGFTLGYGYVVLTGLNAAAFHPILHCLRRGFERRRRDKII